MKTGIGQGTGNSIFFKTLVFFKKICQRLFQLFLNNLTLKELSMNWAAFLQWNRYISKNNIFKKRLYIVHSELLQGYELVSW